MDVGGRLNRASSWRDAGRFAAVRDVASLISPLLTSLVTHVRCQGRHTPLEEDIPCKSFWRLKFIRKDFGKSQTVGDESLTNTRRWRISAGFTAAAATWSAVA